MKVRDILDLMNGDHVEICTITRTLDENPDKDVEEFVLTDEQMEELIKQDEWVDYKVIYKDYLDRTVAKIYTGTIEYSQRESVWLEDEVEPTIILELKQ